MSDNDMNVSEELDTIANTEENAKGENQTNSNITRKERNKLCRLPLARVKHIMKMDPECSIISQDAVVLVTKATELFVELLGKEAVKHTNSSKRKTVLKRDLTTVLETAPSLCFLEGMLD